MAKGGGSNGSLWRKSNPGAGQKPGAQKGYSKAKTRTEKANVDPAKRDNKKGK